MKRLETFKTRVYDSFEKRIDEQYPCNGFLTDPLLIATEQHEAFLKCRARVMLGRDQLVEQVLDSYYYTFDFCTAFTIMVFAYHTYFFARRRRALYLW